MADIAETLERVIRMQADEITRLRQINAGLVEDGREQAKTIRTLVDQRGAVAEVTPESMNKLADNLHAYWCKPGMKWAHIAENVKSNRDVIGAIIQGDVEPIGALRDRIEALISGENSHEQA